MSHVWSTARLPSVKMPAIVTVSAPPSVVVTRSLSPTSTPRSEARTLPMTTSSPATSKRPAMRLLPDVDDGEEALRVDAGDDDGGLGVAAHREPRAADGRGDRGDTRDVLHLGHDDGPLIDRAKALRRGLRRCARSRARPVGSVRGRGASRGTRRVTCGCEPSVLSMSETCRPLMSAERNTTTLTPTDTAARMSAVCPLASRR